MPEQDKLYIWLDGEPGISEPDFAIDDIPGESDLGLLVSAIMEGNLGTILPVTLQMAQQPDPHARKVRSIDVVRLLRAHNIRHRRRYEILLEPDSA